MGTNKTVWQGRQANVSIQSRQTELHRPPKTRNSYYIAVFNEVVSLYGYFEEIVTQFLFI